MPDATGLIPFAEYAPDVFSVDAKITAVAQNVIPRSDSYAPFPSLVILTQTLPGPCRGSFFARNPDGTVSIFAGTSTKLYRMNNTTFTWTDVSNTVAPFSGTYPPLPPFDNWQFQQFNIDVVAVQINVTPQVFRLDGSFGATFVNIVDHPPTGRPTQPIPQASHVAVVNRFLVLSGIQNAPFNVQWSDLDNIYEWEPTFGLSDLQQLPDGGYVHDVRGGDQYGIIFQDNSIRSLIFAPGSPEVFDILRISASDGIYGQYSSVTAGDKIFFYSPQGFKMIQSGGYPTPIGKFKIDVTFFADLDATNLQLFIAATDPMSTRVYWQYKSKGGAAGLADKVLVFDWAVGQNGQWSVLVGQSIEMLNYMAKPGLTLEGVDTLASLAPSVVHITAASAGASGTIRLTVASLPPGNTVTVYGITAGTNQCVEANSSSRAAPHTGEAWFFNVIDPTHIDLIGSTFVTGHTLTVGGVFGGSIDQMPPMDTFSLDSISNDVTLRLAAFDDTNALGFFSGPALEATLDTPESDLGGRVWIPWLRPICDAPGCYGSVGTLETAQQQNIVYTQEQQVNAEGLVPQRVETRYAVARLRVPAGTRWTYASGMRVPDALSDQGDR